MVKKTTIKEVGEMLHHVVKHMATKEDVAELRKEMKGDITDVRKKMATKEEMAAGFAAINRRLDTIIQIQLDQHAGRIKKLETAVFTR